MARWRIEKKAFTQTRRERLSTRALLLVDPKTRLDLNAHLPASLTLYLCLGHTLSCSCPCSASASASVSALAAIKESLESSRHARCSKIDFDSIILILIERTLPIPEPDAQLC